MRNALRVALAVCLSVLVASAAVGCTNSSAPGGSNGNGENGGRMMNGSGPNGRPGQRQTPTSSGTNRGTNGMMNGGGSNSTGY